MIRETFSSFDNSEMLGFMSFREDKLFFVFGFFYPLFNMKEMKEVKLSLYLRKVGHILMIIEVGQSSLEKTFIGMMVFK